MNLVIVESAAKAKTIEKYLNSIQELKRLGSFKVLASFGHIRDLPEKTIGVNISTWTPDYQNMKTKGDIIKKLKQAAKDSKFVYLASDMDLEGESIAMHLKTVLNLAPNAYKRIKFNEITKTALKTAFQNAGDIDLNMFAAQETRRIIDRVVGYELSPLLWRRFTQKSLSAGRVQSVTLQMIKARYNTVINHVPEIYWNCEGNFNLPHPTNLAHNIELNATVYTSKPEQGIMHWLKDDDIQSFLKLLIQLNNKNDSKWKITFTQKKVYKKPSAPFTTSTLQQEVYNRYHITPKTTMRSAQALYEGGFITYMRTDSVAIADDAQKAILNYNIEKYGTDNTTLRVYKTKQENAQEAHECIRPTHPETLVENLPDTFTDIDRKIYNLIWRQTISSQMASAEYNEVSYSIKIPDSNLKDLYFYGKKLILTKEGYLLVYSPDIKVDPSEIKLWEKILKNPEIYVKLDTLHGIPNITKPNSLFNESSIVKALEKEGIGRPSTYASIIDKLFSRTYIEKGESPKKKANSNIYEWKNNNTTDDLNITIKELQTSSNEKDCLLPTSLGQRIVEYLTEYVPFLLNKEFTRHMESDLDKIMIGETNKITILNDFYSIFHGAIEKANKIMNEKNKDKMNDTSNDKSKDKSNDKSNLKPKAESILYKIDEDYIIVKARYGPALLKQSESKWFSIISFIEWKNKSYETITPEDIHFITSLPKQFPNTDRSLYLGPYGLYIKDSQHNYILPKDKWDDAYNNKLDSEYIKSLQPFQPKPKKQSAQPHPQQKYYSKKK